MRCRNNWKYLHRVSVEVGYVTEVCFVLQNFYSLSLCNGQIKGKFAAGGRPVVLQSADTYNDEKLHNIAVVKSGRA